MAVLGEMWQATAGRRWIGASLMLFAAASVGWAYAKSAPKPVIVVHEVYQSWEEGPQGLQGGVGIGVMPTGYVPTTHDVWKGFDQDGHLVRLRDEWLDPGGNFVGETFLTSDASMFIQRRLGDDGDWDRSTYENTGSVGLDAVRNPVTDILSRGDWNIDREIVYGGRLAHLYKMDATPTIADLAPSFSAMIVDAETNRLMFLGLYIRDGELRFGTRNLMYDVTQDTTSIPDLVRQSDF